MTDKIILLADDAKLFLELQKSFLQRTGITILTARDGERALELARIHTPDIIFLDLYMPKMDGDECCRSIKADPTLQNTAVVMVTSKGRPHDLDRCRDAGCDEIILKPINRSDFLQTTKKMLNIPTRDTRFKATIEVSYGDGDGTHLTDFSIDISTGGLYIKTDNPLEVGETLSLRFSLVDSKKVIVCSAKVAWINSPDKIIKPSLPVGMGVQFINISLDDLHIVRDFMESCNLEPSW